MLAAVINIFIGLVITGAIVGGVVLFWIARQDGSRLGRILGIFLPIIAILAGFCLTKGHYWR